MVQIKKILTIIFFLAIISGCNYNNTVNTNYSQTITPKPLATLPANEIKELDGIKYRVISDDYSTKKNDTYRVYGILEQYVPSLVLAEEDPNNGTYDALKASKDGLALSTLEKFKNELGQSFGYANTIEEALKTAIKVINIYYNEKEFRCIEYEQPFYIGYNKIANAWIISGTTDISDDGRKKVVEKGTSDSNVSLALEKDTGILLMLTHDR